MGKPVGLGRSYIEERQIWPHYERSKTMKQPPHSTPVSVELDGRAYIAVPLSIPREGKRIKDGL